MRVNELHPTKYLSAGDLNEEKIIVTIRTVEMEEVGNEDEKSDKPVLYFEEIEKGMVINKTNTSTIATLYGGDTDEWVGEKITLFPTYTTFNKQNVACIRVEPKRPVAKKPAMAGRPAAPARPAKPAPPTPEQTDDQGDESDIPF